MKLNKIIAAISFVAVAGLSSCSEGQYWDEPGAVADVYAFDKTAVTVSYAHDAVVPGSYEVTVSRNNNGPAATVPVSFGAYQLNTSTNRYQPISNFFSGPDEVTFEAGEATATYTISISGTLAPVATYLVELVLDTPEEKEGVVNVAYNDDANLVFDFTLQRVFVPQWKQAGKAMAYSAWAGNEEPIAIPVLECTNNIYTKKLLALESTYWYLEPDYAEKGYNFEFLINEDGSDPQAYSTVQLIGEVGQGYDIALYVPRANFKYNDGVYLIQGYMYAMSGSSAVGSFGGEVLQFTLDLE